MANAGSKSIYRRLGSEDAAGSAVANTVTRTALFTNQTVLANTLRVGDVIEVVARANYGITGTPNITTDISVNGSAVISSGAVATSAAGRVFITAYGLVTAVGSSGSILWTFVQHSNDSALNVVIGDTTADTLDMTANATVNVAVTWGTANASNTITGYLFQTSVR